MTKPSALEGGANDVASLLDDDILIGTRDPLGTPSDLIINGANLKLSLAGAEYVNHRGVAAEGTGYVSLTTHDRISLGDSFVSPSDTYYFPFVVGKEITISHLGVDVYAAATGGNRKIALFKNASGAPGDLIANSLITVDIGTIAYVNTALAANVTLTPDVYWMGMRGDANNGAALRCTTGKLAFGIGVTGPGAGIHNDQSVWCKAVTSPSYATFPEATASAVTYSAGGENIPYLIATLV